MPVKPFGIPPAEAVKLIKAKGFDLMPSFDWRDVWANTHAGAFTVAKSAGFNILGDIYEAVGAAQEGRLTFKEFREQLQPILEKKGWWGKRQVVDPETGEAVLAQLGSPRRLEIIYRTNLRQAEAAGKWARIQALKHKRPFLRYVSVMDKKTREEHRAWHGLILPVDHHFWNEHMPPNGWNCRCSVMHLSQDQLNRWGWNVSDEGAIPFMETEPWLDERGGRVLDIPRGIDPAFAHNPGAVAIEVHAARALANTLAGLPPEVAEAARKSSAEFIARALARGGIT
ncbi:MAG: phage minor head protein [Deltaproteobacteria bacterium]|nr:phage minor head protein [Deltaproteobacteria bacterium]